MTVRMTEGVPRVQYVLGGRNALTAKGALMATTVQQEIIVQVVPGVQEVLPAPVIPAPPVFVLMVIAAQAAPSAVRGDGARIMWTAPAVAHVQAGQCVVQRVTTVQMKKLLVAPQGTHVQMPVFALQCYSAIPVKYSTQVSVHHLR